MIRYLARLRTSPWIEKEITEKDLDKYDTRLWKVEALKPKVSLTKVVLDGKLKYSQVTPKLISDLFISTSGHLVSKEELSPLDKRRVELRMKAKRILGL